MTLADLELGSSSLILGFNSEGENVARLSQLGVIPGAQAQILRAAPFGDPVQVRVEGTLLSIRKSDARFIQVEQM